MDAKTLERLRPTDGSSAAVRAALAQIRSERESTQQRLTDQVARTAELLLTGTNTQIRAAEDATRDAELDLVRLGVMAEKLERQHDAALNREAGEVREHRIREAAAAIEAWNLWFEKEYEGHAKALAQGLQLERDAIRLVDALRVNHVVPHGLPRRAQGHVGKTMRDVGFFVRLPAVSADKPCLWWPH
jgi:hypothetical protein